MSTSAYADLINLIKGVLRMIKVVGFETKKGSFTNQQTGEVIDYDNLIIYYVSDLKKKLRAYIHQKLKLKVKTLKRFSAI